MKIKWKNIAKLVALAVMFSFTTIGVLTLCLMGTSMDKMVYWQETNDVIRFIEIAVGGFGLGGAIVLMVGIIRDSVGVR